MADEFSLSGKLDIYALEISHTGLSTPIRIVNDTLRHSVETNTYERFAFRAVAPQDLDGERREATIEVDNVGRPLMEWVQASDGGRGAYVRMMRLSPVIPDTVDADTVLNSTISWEVTLAAKISRITNDVVSLTLGDEYDLERPGVKIRHDTKRSPGLW